MKVKMCLYPYYIFYPSSVNSPRFVEILEEEGVKIEEYRWDGTLNDIPIDELVIICYSSRVTFSPDELVSFLSQNQLEHFVFYEDEVLLPNNTWSGPLLLPKLKEFLKRKRQEKMHSREKVRYQRRIGFYNDELALLVELNKTR